MITFSEYELEAQKTASYKSADYLPLGLAEETGELIQLFAQAKRKGEGIKISDLKSEVGDVLWVLSQICREHGITLNDAALDNMGKLRERLETGAVHDKSRRT